MQFIVSDANILIDMEVGGLLASMFSLECIFCVPDVLFHEELATKHGDLIGMGLVLKVLTPESMAYVMSLAEKYRRPSRYDLFALSLACQEGCPLLTGDMSLRAAAEEERVAVSGTIWLVEQMVRQGKISCAIARAAYERMEAAGRRLPWAVARESLRRLDRSGC